ncbi:MAG: 16S rRNA (uracil(1498)-N(3))-methyltransferase [Phycisphaerae bacterium]|jgi:16S rRNA (uracil1498-N3)-methyltransferase
MALFYCENITDFVELPTEEARHLAAHRRREGDCIELFDGRGTSAKGVITMLSKRSAALEVTDIRKRPPRENAIITLVISVAKGQRFDWLIAKATELGADRIFPCIYSRTVKTGEGKNLGERYRNLAISACKQCGRPFLPMISPPLTFSEHLTSLKGARLLTASLRGNRGSLFDEDFSDTRERAVFVGPEGGFTPEEEAMLEEAGALNVKLTDAILRTETAALAACSILAAMRDNQLTQPVA